MPQTQAQGYDLPFTSLPPNGQNGRVNFSAPPSAGGAGSALGNGTEAGAAQAFSGFRHQTTSEVVFEKDMLRGNWTTNQLSDAFFSRQNVENLQTLIRRQVYEKSQPRGYVIDNQSVDELKIIMRAMYLQYAKNLPNDIPGQVAELNRLVADWSVPHIMSAVDHYFYYLKDISTLPTPMPQPVSLSRAGSKSLPLNPFM